MSKRFLGFVLGGICVAVAIFMVVSVDSGLVFWIAVLMGSGGMLLISWGSMYFKRNFPSTITGVSNNREKCIRLSGELLEGPKKTIRIVGGDLDHTFYNNKRITEALKEALSSGVKVEIICGPRIDKKDTALIDLEKKHDSLTIDHLSYNPKRHFTIVDKRGVRLEGEHPIPILKDDNVIAKVYTDRPFLAFQLDESFRSLRDKIGSAAEKKPN